MSSQNEILTFGSPAIGLFALLPFYIALRFSNCVFDAFFLSFLHGLFVHLLSSFWLGNFQGYALFTLGASALGTGGFEAIISLFFYYPKLQKDSICAVRLNDDENGASFRVLWFASLYTAWEWCKSTGFLAYPWGTLSMTAFRWRVFTQIADITGPYGVSFLFALFSATLGEKTILLKRGIKKSKSFDDLTRFCAVIFSVVFVYGIVEIAIPRQVVKNVNAVLVQQNGDPWIKGEEESINVSKNLSKEKIDSFRERGEECDIVVWSEAVLSKRFPSAKYFYSAFPEDEPLIKFIDKMNVPFIIGGPVIVSLEPRRIANSALLFTKDGEWAGAYQKMHLVPFAELIPGNTIPFVRKIMKKIAGFSYGWYPGKCVTLYEIPISEKVEDTRKTKIISLSTNEVQEFPPFPQKTVKIATPICFDDTAAEVCRALFLAGSELFMNITNDAWSLTASAEIQHFVVAHYRAIGLHRCC